MGQWAWTASDIDELGKSGQHSVRVRVQSNLAETPECWNLEILQDVAFADNFDNILIYFHLA